MSRANFVQAKLAAAAAAAANTLSIQAMGGAFNLPPADGGLLTITDSLGGPEAHEIIRYTARSGSGPYTLSGVTRGLEGTTARAWSAGAYVVQAVTAGEFDAKQDLIPPGVSSQFYAGDKSWKDLASAVLTVILAGLPAGSNAAIVQTDALLPAMAKLQAQISARAPLASPIFTGAPQVPTASFGDNSLKAASTAFVQTALAALVDSSPAALDTLNELAAALGDDPNFAATMTNALAGKLGKTETAVAAAKLAVARTIALTGEVVGSASTDFSGNVSIAASLSDSGWITPTLVNGWTHVPDRVLQYRLIGPFVVFRGAAFNASFAKNNTTAFALTASCRPNKPLVLVASGGVYLAYDGKALIQEPATGQVSLFDVATQSGSVNVGLDGAMFLVG